MEKRLLSLISMLMLLCGIAAAQAPSTVRGSVTSADDGEAIVGASVMVVGTNIGANTDIDGRFVITNVPSSAKYVTVAYVGMATQEVKIAPNMEIKMKPTLELGEVVVTAMGIKRDKKALGYARRTSKPTSLSPTAPPRWPLPSRASSPAWTSASRRALPAPRPRL